MAQSSPHETRQIMTEESPREGPAWQPTHIKPNLALFQVLQQAVAAVQNSSLDTTFHHHPYEDSHYHKQQHHQQHQHRPQIEEANSDGSGAEPNPQFPPQHPHYPQPSHQQEAHHHDTACCDSFAVAGVRLPVTCNDVRGVAMLDQQVVACYCYVCSQKVASGHDRPLFSYTRFERHCGSKAKKWRLSIRIDPGSVPECPSGDQPLPLGHWLDIKGVPGWAAKSGKVGPRDSDDDEKITRPVLGGWISGAAAHHHHNSGWNTGSGGEYFQYSQKHPGMHNSNSAGAGVGGSASAMTSLTMPTATKRPRYDYETPDPSFVIEKEDFSWLKDHSAAFDTAEAPGVPMSMRHHAVFRVVYALLEQGEERRAFNEEYLPWLNDIPGQRLYMEFSTLHGYLKMLGDDMSPRDVAGMMKGYVRAVLRRINGASMDV